VSQLAAKAHLKPWEEELICTWALDTVAADRLPSIESSAASAWLLMMRDVSGPFFAGASVTLCRSERSHSDALQGIRKHGSGGSRGKFAESFEVAPTVPQCNPAPAAPDLSSLTPSIGTSEPINMPEPTCCRCPPPAAPTPPSTTLSSEPQH